MGAKLCSPGTPTQHASSCEAPRPMSIWGSGGARTARRLPQVAEPAETIVRYLAPAAPRASRCGEFAARRGERARCWLCDESRPCDPRAAATSVSWPQWAQPLHSPPFGAHQVAVRYSRVLQWSGAGLCGCGGQRLQPCKERQCLSHEGSGNTRQRQCLTGPRSARSCRTGNSRPERSAGKRGGWCHD